MTNEDDTGDEPGTAEQYQTNIDEMLGHLQDAVDDAVDAADEDDFTTVRERLAEVNNNIDTLLIQANVEERNAEQGDDDVAA